MWFILGDKVFPLPGGLTVAFHGGCVPHGVWAPAEAEGGSAHWLGMIFVKRQWGPAPSVQ